MTNNQNINLNPVAVDAELGVPLSFRASLPPKALCWHISSSLRSLSGTVHVHRGAQKNSQAPQSVNFTLLSSIGPKMNTHIHDACKCKTYIVMKNHLESINRQALGCILHIIAPHKTPSNVMHSQSPPGASGDHQRPWGQEGFGNVMGCQDMA